VTVAGSANYLSAMAGAAATLTGLVFVAVSINFARVLPTPGLAGRAEESLMQLRGVVAITTTASIPQQTSAALGYGQDGADAIRQHPVLRRWSSVVARGVPWIVPAGAGCIFSLVAGVASAWVLLVEILR